MDSTHPNDDDRPLAPVLAFPTPPPPPPPRSDLTLPLWLYQLIHATETESMDHHHTCRDSPANAALAHDLCDGCYWAALYAQIPTNYRDAATRDLIDGVPVWPPNPTPST